jgi:hypothetical protein
MVSQEQSTLSIYIFHQFAAHLRSLCLFGTDLLTSKFTEAQIVFALKQSDSGVTVSPDFILVTVANDKAKIRLHDIA